MAYAGEASLREVIDIYRAVGTFEEWPEVDAFLVAEDLEHYAWVSPHATLAAALGAARTWWESRMLLSQHAEAQARALDAVRAWLWEPSEERALAIRDLPASRPSPVASLTRTAAGLGLPLLGAIPLASEALPPDVLSAAVRRGVREWVGRGVLI
jgi:hypothetical protein